MAKKKNTAAPEATEATEAAEGEAEFDSGKALSACYGILASVSAAQEVMTEAVQGRLEYKQRQRILVAGMSSATKTVELPWESQRRNLIAGGSVVSTSAAADDGLRREEIEALISHRAGLAVEKAVAELRGQTSAAGEIRDLVEQAISQQAAALESRLLSIVRENLTDSLVTLEESLEERMREIASAAAERQRVNQALEDARKAAEKGIREAGGDELLDQIDDVRDVKLDVGDLFVGDIEERSSVTDELPADAIMESLSGDVAMGGEAADDDFEIEASAAEEEDFAIEASAAEDDDFEIEASAAEDEDLEVDDGVEIDLNEDEEDAVEIDVGGDEIDLDMGDDEVEISQGLGPSLDDSKPEMVVIDSLDAGAEEDAIDEAVAEGDTEAVGRYLELAAKLRDRKNYSAATELYGKVLELDDRNVEAHIGLGAVHLQTPDFEAAASEFGNALELDADSPAGYLGMGEVHFLQKDYAAAIKQYTKCIKLDDELAQAYCNRGLSYYYRKNHKKSFLDLQKAYRIDPEIPNIKKYLQMVMKVLKKKDN